MTPRATAGTYGATTAGVVALILLLVDEPSGRNLAFALIVGACVALATWLHLKRS